jgi:hypothetical protein
MIFARKCDGENGQGEQATTFHGDLRLGIGVAFLSGRGGDASVWANNIGGKGKSAIDVCQRPPWRALVPGGNQRLEPRVALEIPPPPWGRLRESGAVLGEIR